MYNTERKTGHDVHDTVQSQILNKNRARKGMKVPPWPIQCESGLGN